MCLDTLAFGNVRDLAICVEHSEDTGQVQRAGGRSHLLGVAPFELRPFRIDKSIPDRARGVSRRRPATTSSRAP